MNKRKEKYFAQYGQDELIDQLFQKKNRGVFLDIGAHDGEIISNTYFLEKHRNWSGICIEPNPNVFQNLKKNRTCICVKGAVSPNKNQEIASYLQLSGYTEMLGGIIDNYHHEHKKRIEKELQTHGGESKEIKVKTFFLNDLLAELNITEIDYCSIDIEGGELDILKSLDFDKIKIRVFSVEENYKSNTTAFLKSKGYILFQQTGADLIFILKESFPKINLFLFLKYNKSKFLKKMGFYIGKFLGFLKFWGIDISYHKFKANYQGLKLYKADLQELKRQKNNDDKFFFGEPYPIFGDRNTEAGTIGGHYFHQDLYVAKQIFEDNPQKHVDIGSRIDGFIAHLAVFRKVEILDIRSLSSTVKNISFQQADLMKLPKGMTNYCDSISSLHAIEHFGLGRYGDPVDYYGYLKAIDNITKILKKGGRFYFSVPIGPQRIMFNAHRIFSIDYLKKILEKDYKILNFSYVDDAGAFHGNVALDQASTENNFNCQYGCGIFTLLKK